MESSGRAALTPTGTPSAQKIVIGEFDQTASTPAVNLLLEQCGYSPVTINSHTNSGDPGALTIGAESTLDATIVAAALPANASMTIVNSPTAKGWYGLFVNLAQACGLTFASDPWTGLSALSKGSGYPAGGCIISLSYGGAESLQGTTDKNEANWVTDQLAQNGVIISVSAGDEGSGACISTSGTNFGNGTLINLSNFSATSSIATLTSTTSHGFTPNQNVFIGALAPGYDAMYRVLTVPSPTTFTVAMNYPDQLSTAITAVASTNFGTVEPSYPATSPNVLAVGGTQWDPPSQSLTQGVNITYQAGVSVSNYVWRDSNPNPNCANLANYPTSGGQGTGGGISNDFAMPSYQVSAANSSYPSATAKRMMPDLAGLSGWPGYALANPGLAIAGAELSSGVATIYTKQNHGTSTGGLITVSGLPAPFAALNQVSTTIIAATTHTLSFALTGPGIPPDIPSAYVTAGQVSQSCSAPCSAATFPWMPVFGTSASTPLTAIGIANVNAVLSSKGLATITNDAGAMDIHSIVYSSENSIAFTDVTQGSNDIQSLGNYSALPGFDMTTGMGVPNFATMANLLVARLTPSGGGGGTVPAAPTTPSQAGDPVVLEPVVISPDPLPPFVAPPAVTTIARGVKVSTGPNVTTTKRVFSSKKVSSKLTDAPRITIPKNRWRVPVVRTNTRSQDFMAQIRIGRKWQDLGVVTSNPRGVTALPSMRVARKGTYPIRLITQNKKTYFTKLKVTSKRS